MRKITGTQIRGEVKLINTKLQAINANFPLTLSYFEGEEKPDPIAGASEILSLELELGKWQAAQKEFNVNTRITFNDKSISLQEAINIVGGYSRLAKIWKDASGAKKKDRYERMVSRRTVKEDGKTEALSVLTTNQALAEYVKVERAASELRTKIGLANNTELEVISLG